MQLRKPKKLNRGDTLAIVSPSWGGPGIFPHIFDQGLANLRSLGFNIVEMPSARTAADVLFSQPQLRAKDINDAFADPNIAGIISSIGGSDSARILPYLDKSVILNNPKFMMGYSDFSTLTTLLNQWGLVTFNGPSVMAGFSQYHNASAEYQAYLVQALLGEVHYPIFKAYSHGYPEWAIPENVGKLHPAIATNGPKVLQGTGQVEGRLFGGCFEVMEMLKGTEYWPSPSFWQDKLLFLETSEDKPSQDYIRFWLRNYGVMGVFEKLSGLMIGRARDYSEREMAELDEVILSVVRDEFGCDSLPVITRLDFGHTDPQWILPLGIQHRLDLDNFSLNAIEPVFDLL
ncbi:S66 peptidase family protein [Pseudoalteromonas sp. JC3]|uniref:S66 family peptidase n=1 Tax=Pseudoalteromonas sp. JC3 TaxID=2810196 RepID=UPI0019CF9CFD|nr:S66 peptidase family protein [Pseudoalteromonas sp. JC3]MBR8844049.1 LD-carboxypeptidase [Pseudoalteromonas sp. JC3]WJE07956.1 LD-carboxypeptidase [Pseudoalteromonas sp. JC3]